MWGTVVAIAVVFPKPPPLPPPPSIQIQIQSQLSLELARSLSTSTNFTPTSSVKASSKTTFSSPSSSPSPLFPIPLPSSTAFADPVRSSGTLSLEFILKKTLISSTLKREGGVPDCYTYPSVIKACSTQCEVSLGSDLHGSALRCGLKGISLSGLV
ncbi:hypothetical protein CFP56_023644 [Quercus suber]|uniref:Uncharacterized protein n=1 Tax=Quercus suber TaxID=58331 RepID=A0AAW0LYI1_QUESU